MQQRKRSALLSAVRRTIELETLSGESAYLWGQKDQSIRLSMPLAIPIARAISPLNINGLKYLRLRPSLLIGPHTRY